MMVNKRVRPDLVDGFDPVCTRTNNTPALGVATPDMVRIKTLQVLRELLSVGHLPGDQPVASLILSHFPEDAFKFALEIICRPTIPLSNDSLCVSLDFVRHKSSS
ncbi:MULTISPECIES: hypothetical protein [unclassified Thioalkalivibrio]|uniref:hypothetical protein n=1 Tax=unclassified Thioalkalivibrio TaxID=2621013 RepID=UPI0018CA5344|nr:MULTISPECIES: hypothetical protein [unclassified Thioalkalivibrio]